MTARRRGEAGFQAAVIEMAHAFRWKVVEFRKVLVQRRNGSAYWATPFGADGKGFVDLILAKPPRLLHVELKVPPNVIEPSQAEWHRLLRECGGTVLVWTPEDWEVIERTLR